MIKPRFRLDGNRIPILSKNDIDALGEAYIQDFCPEAMTHPSAIDIDQFVSYHLGMEQDFAWLSNDGRYLGMTVFNDTNRVIVYDPERNEADYMSVRAGTVIIDNTLLGAGKEHRYRFTMGHEGGHGILHSAYFAYDPNQLSFFDDAPMPMVQCRADSIATISHKDVRYWTPQERMEWQANRLASALLMPRAMVYKLIQNMPQEQSVDFDIHAILTAADVFNVSYEAAQYRLLDFDLIHSRTPVRTLLDFANAIDPLS